MFNVERLNDLDENSRVAIPWAHLLNDTTVTCVWRETETSWVGVEDGSPSDIAPAPVVLMAHPCAATLAGSGDAIAWLESWRSQQQCTSTSKTAESKRIRLPLGLEQRPQPAESPRKKPRVSTAVPNAVEPHEHAATGFIERPNESPRKKPRLAASHVSQLPAPSDDEPEFVEGSSSGTPRKRKWKIVYNSEGREVIDLT